MAKQVLIIDDDQNMVRYLSVALSEHGYDPVSARDGNDGFRVAFDCLRESLRKKIQEMREDGLSGPEMFVEKPVNPDSFIAKVQQLIGN